MHEALRMRMPELSIRKCETAFQLHHFTNTATTGIFLKPISLLPTKTEFFVLLTSMHLPNLSARSKLCCELLTKKKKLESFWNFFVECLRRQYWIFFSVSF